MIYILRGCIEEIRNSRNQLKIRIMKTKNLIGLDSENAQQVVNLLNELLANYQIYYQNLRGFHWNVRGNRFFVLHAKFEERCYRKGR